MEETVKRATPRTLSPLQPGLIDDELGAQTIRDPFGLSPTASSVAPAPPSPAPGAGGARSPALPTRASGVDAGAWDLFQPPIDQTLLSSGSTPRAPLSVQDIAALEVFARITAAVRRDGPTPETLARFGLDASTWGETERTFAERLAGSPSLARAFATMLARVRP